MHFHEFPDGLPPGTYDFWISWRAPCSAWTSAAVCGEDDTPVALFAAIGTEQPFYHDDYTPAEHAADFPDPEFFTADDWPFDPWRSADG